MNFRDPKLHMLIHAWEMTPSMHIFGFFCVFLVDCPCDFIRISTLLSNFNMCMVARYASCCTGAEIYAGLSASFPLSLLPTSHTLGTKPTYRTALKEGKFEHCNVPSSNVTRVWELLQAGRLMQIQASSRSLNPVVVA